MVKATVSHTALGAATCRLIEQYQPEGSRLFTDPLIKFLVGAPTRVLMQLAILRKLTIAQTDAIAAGIYGIQVCRTRYMDEAVLEALSQGIEQVVILGAGLDTRAYRLPGIERAKVFEVDLPAAQYSKKQKIQKALGKLPGNVSFIPIDFDTQSLQAAFQGTVFTPESRAVFIWEGVSQYLTEKAVRQSLDFVGSAACGSLLVFTYVLKSIIERRSDIPNANQLMDMVGRDAPWLFGLEPTRVPDFLEPYHLKVTSDVGNAFFQEHYLIPAGRHLVVFEGERIVKAVSVRHNRKL